MTDVPEGATGPGRRPARAGDGGAPVSGALTIVLAIVAVVAGFLILRAISDDDDDTAGGSNGGATESTVDAGGSSVPAVTAAPAVTTTTVPALVTEGATVVVANANNINGSAGQMSRALEGAGYTMGEPTDAADPPGQIETTVIYFNPANGQAQAVAESVGRSLGGGVSISEVATPAPTADGEFTGDVLVMLGTDKAGRTLEELAPSAGDTATTAPGVTAPAVSGSSTPTSAAG